MTADALPSPIWSHIGATGGSITPIWLHIGKEAEL